MQRGVSVIPVVSVGCVLAAWLTADYFRVGMFSVDRWQRPVLLLASLATGAVIGAAVEGLRRHGSGAAAWVAPIGLAPILGSIIPLFPPLTWTSRTLREAASTGAVVGALVGPVLALLAWLAVRAERARNGSLVAGADRRAPAVLLATLGVASLPLVVQGAPQFTRFAWPAVELTFVVGFGLVLAIVYALASDLMAWVTLTRTARALGPRAPVALADVGLADPICDGGLGDGGARAEAFGGTAYRRGLPAGLVLLGDVARCSRALRFAVIRDAGALAFSVLWLSTIELRPALLEVSTRCW